MRVDYENRRLWCSVGDIVDESAGRRAGLDRGEGFRRMWIGQRVHTERADQRAAEDPKYRSEVPVAHDVKVDQWSVTVTGRIDGLTLDPDLRVAMIEEVKSLLFARELWGLKRSEKLQRHLYQLMLYALFLSKEPDYEGWLFIPQLVLVDLLSGETEILDAPFDRHDAESAFEASLSRIVAELESERALRAAKREHAESLEFPHPSMRPYQQEMIDAVDRAVKEGEALLVSAPTGIGKTIAAIWPALRETLALGKKLFYLTPKTLQQEMAVETLGLLNDGSFRVLRIRSKRKMCANDEVICHEDYCPYAKRYGEKMDRNGVIPHLVSTMSYFDPEAIFDYAKSLEVCPFEVTLELIEEADVVVCDYNYIFDPWIGLSSYRGESDYSDCVLIVDEAHNLLDRARGYFSPELDERSFEAIRLHLAGRPACSLEGWEELVDEMRAHFDELASLLESDEEEAVSRRWSRDRNGPVQMLCEPDSRLFRHQRESWEHLVLRYIEWKIENRIADAEDPLVDFYFRLVRFTQLLEEEGDDLARIVERGPDGIRLKIFCKDPSRHLEAIFDSAHATIAFSATLEPFDFHRKTLGLPEGRCAELSLPSPFPRDNRRILVVPQVDTTWKKRAQHFGRIAELVGEISSSATGNFLALFPSYAFLDEVATRIHHTGKTVMIQRSDMTDWERKRFLDVMREAPDPGSLVLAVSGGMYAEGIDYRGEMLSGVIVVGPALPSVSFEQELLKRYYDEHYGLGFEYAYLIPGMTRVVQSAGRVIRSETDIGIIALLCRRFLMDSYSRYFPTHWYDDSPRELVSRTPGDDVRVFFERKRSGNMRLF